MLDTTRHITPNATAAPGVPPRWVVRAAHLAALAPLPSGLWRLAAALGVPVGFTGANALADVTPGSFFSLYMIALSLAAEALGLLALGLVRRWGEVFWSWLPLLGGRRVPTWFAVPLAGAGALALTVLTVLGAFGWNQPDTMADPEAPKGVAYLVMTACYAPLLAWGPLLAVVTAHYWLRRRRAARLHSAAWAARGRAGA
ncbi:hypothetical protein J7W19_15395 [Streptomyces mobaraensis NBRC 13819 = DSM 40847]|uniref:Uncharacterized protein n=1 Tax=Streptomyces mobaraensis (strain ATCC 29032 / DSM 40847 / JCM 4168 / NBRC 13819 / NCIMB 11159 / IPCR 16-22) TaxID=1223523 RepID=M3BHN2_STRM1|nr:hypothetical protein [Streptomyces mobaraensis]EME99089.1 hypothetical protein H340_18304 [Streptomyces mobaraensis NBRC 13819 = DSM 40847]QTT74590.1 hypothetical protein J7W19_15395 [Streptomyces mobaraensis NBRC 13819 = DSM 40847]